MSHHIIYPYKEIGLIGLIVIGSLFLFVCARAIKFFYRIDYSNKPKNFEKRAIFYLLVCLNSFCDLPMYYGLYTQGNYIYYLFAFHRLQDCLLFAAFSMTIYDWSHVLFEISEFSGQFSFIFSKYALIFINICFICNGLLNFIYILIIHDLNKYVDSIIYHLDQYIQGIISLIFVFLMLSCGLSLTYRIKAVAGTKTTSNSAQNSNLKDALFIINSVMGIIFCSILIQVIFLGLNHYLHAFMVSSVALIYSFWIFYYWLPLVAPVLALLYINRSSIQKKKSTHTDIEVKSFENPIGKNRQSNFSTASERESRMTNTSNISFSEFTLYS